MDEVNDPQTPVELFFILSMLATAKIPLQTIAPRFSGRLIKVLIMLAMFLSLKRNLKNAC